MPVAEQGLSTSPSIQTTTSCSLAARSGMVIDQSNDKVCVELSNTWIIHFTDNGDQSYSPK
jgi:hypothetical protein